MGVPKEISNKIKDGLGKENIFIRILDEELKKDLLFKSCVYFFLFSNIVRTLTYGMAVF